MAHVAQHLPEARFLSHFDGARGESAPTQRLAAITRAGEALHEELSSAPPVTFCKSFDLVRAPYPTRFGLREACALPFPFLHILNRLVVVQFATPFGLRTLLVSPTDPLANAKTPFFRRLRELLPVPSVTEPMLAPITATVAQCLKSIGMSPAEVDYITYDHLHTQDLRPWLGDGELQGYFPRAKLLVRRQEWESVHGLLPPQRDWYCPDGTLGVDPERVVLFEGDMMLGSSVLLMSTPGHTEGNHSIVLVTPEGPLVTSENGIAADCYAPEHSEIPGVRSYAASTGMDVVINGNTLEGSIDQYLSMVQERVVAGPSKADPRFPNVAPSSELAESWLAPGLRPTHAVGTLEFGVPVLESNRTETRIEDGSATRVDGGTHAA